MGSIPQRGAGRDWTVRAAITRGLALFLSGSLAFLVFGDQDANRSTVPRSPDVYPSDTAIVVRSDLVLIPVTVTDNSGKVVPGLGKEHFTLFEDKTRQEITHFAFEDAPASIGIIFDASDSMSPRIDRARQAVASLLDSANPKDEFFVVRFSTEARLAVPMTSHFDQVRNYVDGMHITGTTALLDGVRLGMEEMKQAHHQHKALIIISDGDDNASHWSVRELKTAVREQGILIYAIGICDSNSFLPNSPFASTGSALLNDIATQSGGRLYEVKKLAQLPEIAAKIGGCLRNQYMLGYTSNRVDKDGAYRAVQLKVARPKGYPRLHVVWRQGYYAPKD